MAIWFHSDFMMWRVDETLHINFDFELRTGPNGYHGSASVGIYDYNETKEIEGSGYGLIQFRSTVTLPENQVHLLKISAIDFFFGREVDINYNLIFADGLTAASGTNDIDVIFGAAGSDYIITSGGDDFLDGGDGNDLLDGGAGADYLIGGNGNDAAVYVSSTVGVTVSLSDPAQNTGDAAGDIFEYVESISGSRYDDTLIGDGQANVLNGRQGADVMSGGGLNDTYYVDNAGDIVKEVGGNGHDTLFALINLSLKSGQSVEVLSAYNPSTMTTPLRLAGNSYGNAITGNAGSNFINGGKGQDTLTGLGGNDTFMFNSPLDWRNVDRITDYNDAGNDTIRLENGVFTAIEDLGWLDADAFVANTSGYAQDAEDRVIYEIDTGKLIYDSNGTGAGGRYHFAWVDENVTLTSDDFFVV